jgi:putative oxidoreductase
MLRNMQKLFSMFPAGLPGVALLLVRTSVALALLLTDYGHRHVLPVWIHGIAILISVALLVGYLTPIAAATALLFQGLLWFGTGVDSAAVTVIFALDAIALALLGPGAYSIDSHRFGRLLVVLPPPQ